MKTLSALARSLSGILICACSVSSSCTFHEEFVPAAEMESEGMAEISFMVRMPAVTAVVTRSETGTVQENRIDDIHVLVFETTGKLLYKGRGKNVAQSGTNGNSVAFKATLPIGKTYDFMVLANAESPLSRVTAGVTPAMTKVDVEALVQQATAENSEGGKWKSSAPIPMWDEQTMELTTSSTPVFHLMRMLARINVEYKPVTAADDLFRITGVRYYNYNTCGKIVPATGNLSGTGNGRHATGPTLPDNPGTQFERSAEYTHTAITDHKTCKNLIYVFEAANCGRYTDGGDAWVRNPCLVVGGKYDSDKDGDFDEESVTWYRIDFIRKTTSGGTTTEQWLSMLRNFSYSVVISSVNGDGYGDPDVALKSVPLNIKAGVIDWNDGQMDEVIFDGTAYLSVDKHELIFPRRRVDVALADGSNVLRIKTDYAVSGYPENSGWKVEYYTDREGAQPMANPWLKLINGDKIDKGAPTGTPDHPAAVTHFAFSENPGSVNREAWVYITAGRLRYCVHVMQKLLSVDLFEVVGGEQTPKDSMLFVVPHAGWGDRDHAPRTFRVRWRPTNKQVVATNRAPVLWNPFDPAWIRDVTAGGYPLPGPGDGDVWSFTDQSGERDFVVDPFTVTGEDLGKDPFWDKQSTYWFEVDNDGEVEKQGIALQQIHYNIVVDTHRYRLDGTTSTLTVRSNTEWKITKIREWLYNNDPATTSPAPSSPVMLQLRQYDNLREGSAGGPNVNGDAVAFTTVNAETAEHKGKWGTVYVTFESPTGKFPPREVELVFPPASRLILGLGYALDVRSNNVAFGTPHHLNSAFQMISSPYNFGSMDQSVVKVEGLRIKGYNTNGLPDAVADPINPDFDWHTWSLMSWLNNDNPDVIVSSSFQTLFPVYTDRECQLLKQYLERGGAVIMMYNAGSGGQDNVARFMKHIFGGNYTTAANQNSGAADVINWNAAPATGAVYRLVSGPAYQNDPILNGPFGDIRGKYWGSHYYRSSIRSSLIADDAEVYSTAAEITTGSGNANHAIIWRHKKYNLLFIGQEGFTSSYYDYYATVERGHDPFKLDADRYFYPVGRPGFNNAASPYTVYNSVLLANAVAWALTVTNHMPPADGYVLP